MILLSDIMDTVCMTGGEKFIPVIAQRPVHPQPTLTLEYLWVELRVTSGVG
jgi:hypothetical protein